MAELVIRFEFPKQFKSPILSNHPRPFSLLQVNIGEINNELMEFQNRCRKLPKALKEWPAFHALKKTIDDFNDICPLLELMSNKAMKYRHWQKIQGITGEEKGGRKRCNKGIY